MTRLGKDVQRSYADLHKDCLFNLLLIDFEKQRRYITYLVKRDRDREKFIENTQ